MESKKLTVTVSTAVYKKLIEFCKKYEMCISHAVEAAIIKYLKQEGELK